MTNMVKKLVEELTIEVFNNMDQSSVTYFGIDSFQFKSKPNQSLIFGLDYVINKVGDNYFYLQKVVDNMKYVEIAAGRTGLFGSKIGKELEKLYVKCGFTCKR